MWSRREKKRLTTTRREEVESKMRSREEAYRSLRGRRSWVSLVLRWLLLLLLTLSTSCFSYNDVEMG